jgi:hypothetical protein
MRHLTDVLFLVEGHIEYALLRKAKRELELLTELAALCREDILTDAPEYAERVTRAKNIVGAL